MTADPFTLSFGIKAVQEYEHEGAAGLLLQGYATRFGEVDQSGEHMTAAALSDLEDTWAAEPAPLVLFEHGLSELGARRIGKAIEHRIDEQGLHVSVFVPKEPRWKDSSALRKFSQVYRALRDGLVRGFSVGGTYTRDTAGAIKRWSTLELSITARPCLPSATFTVGAKAIGEAYGALPPILDDADDHDGDHAATGGSVSFVHTPQPHSTAGLASVPISVPAGNVTVSAPVDAAPGAGWTLSYAAGGTAPALVPSAKDAPAKSEPDGAKHPRSHYLYTPSDNVSEWKLRVKNAQGDLDARLLGACHAALLSPGGYRGNKVDLPDAAKQECIAKLRRLYEQAGLDWPDDQATGARAQATEAGKKAHLLRAALAVLRDFELGAKQGRQHSAATVAAVRKIADGLDAHVGMLRDHFGLQEGDDDDQDQDADQDADQEDDERVVS